MLRGRLGPSHPFLLLRAKHMARWPWSVVVAGDLRTRDFSDFKELDEDLQDDDWLVEVVRSNRQSITTNLPLHAGSGGRVPPSRSNRRNITTKLPLHAGSGGRVPPSRLNRQNITTNLPLHAGSGGSVPPSRTNRRNITTNLHVTNALGQLSSVFGFTSRQKFISL